MTGATIGTTAPARILVAAVAQVHYPLPHQPRLNSLSNDQVPPSTSSMRQTVGNVIETMSGMNHAFSSELPFVRGFLGYASAM